MPARPAREEEIVAAYRDTVRDLYRFVARRTPGDRALAEDVVQETYARAVASWVDAGLPERPLAWLRTVAGNLLANHFRRSRPARIAPQDLETWLAAPRVPASAEVAALVQWGIARLPSDRAGVLQAFYVDGLSTRQLAERENATEKAIERRLARARQELRARLRPHVGGMS